MVSYGYYTFLSIFNKSFYEYSEGLLGVFFLLNSSFINSYMGFFITIKSFLKNYLDGIVLTYNSNYIYLYVSSKVIKYVILSLKFFFRFDSLVDLFAVDLVDFGGTSIMRRFELNYVLINTELNMRIIIKSFLDDTFCSVESICSIYRSVLWLEREVWDMFGIFFYNHFDLRRILTDYGFLGFPLRKDFPLVGYIERSYDIFSNNLIDTFVEFSQAFRNFKNVNSWR